MFPRGRRLPCCRKGTGRSSGASERLCMSGDSLGSLRRGENRCVELGMLSKFQQVVVQGLMACYQQYEDCLEVEQEGGGVKGGGRGFLGDRNLGNTQRE